MESMKHSVLIIFLVMVSLTTSRAMDTLWKNTVLNSSSDTTEDPAKNFLNVDFKSFMGDTKDVQSAEDADNKMPEPSDSIQPAVIPFSDSRGEVAPPADGALVDTTNNTMNLGILDFESVMVDSKEDSMDEPAGEATIIFIRPKPKIFMVQVREFHECISCNIEDEPRKHFDQCLQKLSFKNQEIAKSCCTTSFDNDFCESASTGKIDYVTICQHPEKALKVGDCFWQKIEDKVTADITEYRECKKQILENYCTVKSFKEIEPDMVDTQV